MSSPRYRLARGVRLRREDDGTTLLLVPEGVVELNDSAAATLELLDGARTLDELSEALRERFEADASALRSDVEILLDELRVRGFVTA
jgi:pyrroloquinoline quinone biosynthesis protein D